MGDALDDAEVVTIGMDIEEDRRGQSVILAVFEWTPIGAAE